MSKFSFQTPVKHIPSFKEYKIDRVSLLIRIRDAGLYPFEMLDNWYYCTDDDGWIEIIPHLCLNSSLYKPERRDCEWFGLKAMVNCHSDYGLNGFGLVIGNHPLGRHGWNILVTPDDLWMFEPNDGFPESGQIFSIGGFGYDPERVLI